MSDSTHIDSVPLQKIRTDGGTQPRASLDAFVIDDYAEAMQGGAQFPPVTVFYDGNVYWLADGFHRYHAAKKAQRDTISAEVSQGTRRDAVLHSVGANADHGLRRTNADKRRAVETLLRDDEWCEWSDRDIAKKCKVSHPFVGSVRRSMTSGNDYHLQRRHLRGGKEVVSRHTPTTTKSFEKPELPALSDPVRETLRDSDVTESKTALRAIASLPQEAQKDVAGVVASYGVADSVTIRAIGRAYSNREKNGSSNTFEEIAKTGYIQPGDEEEAVHITDDPERVLWALGQKSQTHRQIAGDIKKLADHQLLNVSDNNEWYTPKRYLDAVHEVMGGVDVDPASNEYANQTVRAATFYTINDDGYTKEWCGRVFLNPPYGRDDENNESNQSRWSKRLIEQYKSGVTTEAILLVNAVPGNKWFAPLWDYPICFVDHRIRFYNKDTEAGQPTHSNAFVYLGRNADQFARAFSKLGVVAVRYGVQHG